MADAFLVGGKLNVGKKFQVFKEMVAENESLRVKLPRNISSISWHMAQKSIMAVPCCPVCQKSDYDYGVRELIEWKCCSRCKYGWACAEHHEDYMKEHTKENCNSYIQCSKTELFRYNHTINYGDHFMCMPENPLTVPMESFPKTWEEYFKMRCEEYYNIRHHLPEEFFPVSTFLLSQVTTCLHGMYLHNKEFFTTTKELTIHVLGPGDSYEYKGGSPTCIWEEIMHCLPAVNKMKVIFTGPEGKLNFPLSQFDACPDCNIKGRIRMQGFHDMTYHDYYASDQFVKPDFVVAFNTGIFEEYTESWKESLRVLLSLDVPCLFTSYNENEGDADFGVLEEVHANTLTNKTMPNPFAVNIPLIDDSCIDRFFRCNMYYVCFQGRQTQR
eukprot:CCRYP_005843-RA/>CCRYP_005843-RA protein AED:0.16 eAED:0.14 QI:0/-1/0/1/-1/1/1/0/384